MSGRLPSFSMNVGLFTTAAGAISVLGWSRVGGEAQGDGTACLSETVKEVVLGSTVKINKS